MEVLKSLIEMFKGKNNLFGQLALFSISGIIALCFNICISATIGSFYGDYLGYAPSSNLVISLCFLVGVAFSIFIA